MGLHQELIELYSAGKISDIEQTQEFERICTTYEAAEGFEAERLRIRRFKKCLEDLCHDQTNSAQVRLCIKLLAGEKKEEDRTDYYDLIMHAYSIYWSAPQQEHFDKAYTILKGDVYFFLSFTTRDVKKVNRENRYFLESAFWADKGWKKDLSNKNLLAEAIFRYLKGQGLSGFYYPMHEGQSNRVMERLRDNCHKALTFVQLVEGVLFDFKDPNFCHFEYEEALKSQVCHKRIYILGEAREDIQTRRNIVANNWLPWFDEIVNDVDALQFVSTPYRDDLAVRKNHEVLKSKIVKQIIQIRDNLFEKVPV